MTNAKARELENEKESKGNAFGYRHQQCIILFLCLTTSYSIRSCMGVALVAMTSVPANEDDNFNIAKEVSITGDANCINRSDINVTDDVNRNYSMGDVMNASDEDSHGVILNALMLAKPYPTFDWNKKIQDTILSAFFWGYMFLQIPSGMLTHRFGTKNLIFGSMLINSFIFIILPWAAYYGGWICLVICRLIQGLSQSCIVPALNTFFGKWAPMQERGRMSGSVNGGSALGSVLGLLITGFIASSSLGWPGIFRFYGLLCGVCSLLLWFFVADTPAKHPTISTAERVYIEKELGDGKARPPVPWRKVLTCRGVWAMTIAHTGNTWGQLTLFSEVPAYMDKIMGVNIKTNSLFTALPFFCMWLCNFLFCYLVDLMINKKIFSVTTTRKIANSVGSVIAGLGLIALCYVPKNIYVVEALLIIICSFKIASQMGFGVTNIDIAPNFSGTIMSISNFVANAIGSCAPVTAGLILTDVTSEARWRIVFFVAAAFYLITNLVFVVLGTNETADWNDPAPDKEKTRGEEQMKPLV